MSNCDVAHAISVFMMIVGAILVLGGLGALFSLTRRS